MSAFLLLLVIFVAVVWWWFRRGPRDGHLTAPVGQIKTRKTLTLLDSDDHEHIATGLSGSDEVELLPAEPVQYVMPDPELLYDLGGDSILERLEENEDAMEILREVAAFIEQEVIDCDIPGRMTSFDVFPNGMIVTFTSPLGSVVNGFVARAQAELWIFGYIVSSPIGSDVLHIFAPDELPNDPKFDNERERLSFTTLQFNGLLNSVAISNDVTLPIVLGADRQGEPYIADLKKLRNIAIIGSTGSGKSVAVDDIILSLVWRRSPQDVRFIVISDKESEYTVFQDLPHMLARVITTADRYADSLKFIVSEIKRRRSLLVGVSVRSIEAYNTKVGREGLSEPIIHEIFNEKLSYLCVIADAAAFAISEDADEFANRLEALKFILDNGAKVGVHVVYCAHARDDMLSHFEDDWCTYFMLGRTEVDYNEWFPNHEFDELPESKGDALIVGKPPFPEFVHLALVSDETREAIAEHWAKQRTRVQTRSEPEGDGSGEAYGG